MRNFLNVLYNDDGASYLQTDTTAAKAALALASATPLGKAASAATKQAYESAYNVAKGAINSMDSMKPGFIGKMPDYNKIAKETGLDINKVSGNGLGSAASTTPKNFYPSIKDAPKYPEGFTSVQDGTVSYTVKNKVLLTQLRDVEPGE